MCPMIVPGSERIPSIDEARCAYHSPALPAISRADETLPNLARAVGDQVLVVASNREPYVHRAVRGNVLCERPAGGVTAVLDPVLQALDGIWVAWGSGDADSTNVDAGDRVRVPPDAPSYTLRRVWLTAEDVRDYYFGYANRFLWPLCHVALDRVVYRRRYWDAYRRINERFAQAILQEIGDRPGIVWVHDYQLALCPLFLRRQRPDLRIALFWHIPWPAPDVFRICPQRRELLESLLACDQVGFHLGRYRRHFVESAKAELVDTVESQTDLIVSRDHVTRLSAFPVSIDVQLFERLAGSEKTARRMSELRREFNLGPGSVFGLGVDRLDYTKGLHNRLLAVEEFLSRYPEYHGRFLFVQVAAHTRAQSEPYKSYGELLQATVAEINARFGCHGWAPIKFIDRSLSQEVLVAYYRLADVCLVSSVYDGLNLVSKEYVTSKIDDTGVLVLSEMAGSLEELGGALPINPYDVEGMAATLYRAINLPEEERRARMRRMRHYVRTHDIYRWMEANFEAMTSDATV